MAKTSPIGKKAAGGAFGLHWQRGEVKEVPSEIATQLLSDFPGSGFYRAERTAPPVAPVKEAPIEAEVEAEPEGVVPELDPAQVSEPEINEALEVASTTRRRPVKR